jgi:hypothetical protein
MFYNKKKYQGYRVDKVLRMRGNKQNVGTGLIFTDVDSGEVIIGKQNFCDMMGIGIGILSHKLIKLRAECFEQPLEINGRKFTFTKNTN